MGWDGCISAEHAWPLAFSGPAGMNVAVAAICGWFVLGSARQSPESPPASRCKDSGSHICLPALLPLQVFQHNKWVARKKAEAEAREAALTAA